jgi:NAD-dependent SIR2 family protein deacetylase
MTTKYTRLYCGSCGKVLGWREAREDTRWILALCDDCYDEKDKTKHESVRND